MSRRCVAITSRSTSIVTLVVAVASPSFWLRAEASGRSIGSEVIPRTVAVPGHGLAWRSPQNVCSGGLRRDATEIADDVAISQPPAVDRTRGARLVSVRDMGTGQITTDDTLAAATGVVARTNATDALGTRVHAPHPGWLRSQLDALSPTDECTVTSTADQGAGSLRDCLSRAVANTTVTFDGVVFPAEDSPGRIMLTSGLPNIHQSGLSIEAVTGSVILDGSSIRASSTYSTSGIVIFGATDVTIHGLEVRDFPDWGVVMIDAVGSKIGGPRSGDGNRVVANGVGGIAVSGTQSTANVIAGNFVGAASESDLPKPRTPRRHGGPGVAIINSGQNLVGGPGDSRNVIAGNAFSGVQITGPGATRNRVVGNMIGTDPAGSGAGANAENGVIIAQGASRNLIGGAAGLDTNVVSGNGGDGVHIRDAGTIGNLVSGNKIGVDVSGISPLPNRTGIRLAASASDNTVGHLADGGDGVVGDGNVISGNSRFGVLITGVGTDRNVVTGNMVGVSEGGRNLVKGHVIGVVITAGARANRVGGSGDSEGNTIGGNGTGALAENEIGAGILVQSEGGQVAEANEIVGNRIGVTSDGNHIAGNVGDGVRVERSSHNRIGGGGGRLGNIITGNERYGLIIEGPGADGNIVEGNRIGVGKDGLTSMPNWEDGVAVSLEVANTRIGGEDDSRGNVVSGNSGVGIRIQGPGVVDTLITGNHVGVDVSGVITVPNRLDGIVVVSGAVSTTIGGGELGEQNVVGGNGGGGILVQNPSTSRTTIAGNYIGIGADGTTVAGNDTGVGIGYGARDVTVGGLEGRFRNVISGNMGPGVMIQDDGTTGSHVVGNLIGVAADGSTRVPNESGVVVIQGADGNRVGNGTAEGRNIISGNRVYGVKLQDEGTRQNVVAGNYIGTDQGGTSPARNGRAGVGLERVQENVIGGPGAGNVISGNGNLGVWIQGPNAYGNHIAGNLIGVARGGGAALPNENEGVGLGFGAIQNVVGGDNGDEGNTISGNCRAGILVQNPDTFENRIEGNRIGVASGSTDAIPNLLFGVMLNQATSRNVVGGYTDDAKNVVAGNYAAGIVVRDPGTVGNEVIGNWLGLDGTQPVAVPNSDGIVIIRGATENVVGGAGGTGANTISGNRLTGVSVEGSGTDRNVVRSNRIGTSPDGRRSVANAIGVVVADGASATVIGGRGAEGNVISGNSQGGVQVVDAATTMNAFESNLIGVGLGGALRLPNWGPGLWIARGAVRNVVGVSNTIAFNGAAGVVVDGEDTTGNTVTRSIIYANAGVPVRFGGWSPPPRAPVITDADRLSGRVSGVSCAGCTIEIFAQRGPRVSAHAYLGTTIAETDGTFDVDISATSIGKYVSASATDTEGTTSAFSAFALDGWPAFLPEAISGYVVRVSR